MKSTFKFKKKELALAVSVAVFSGMMTGCSNSNDGPAVTTPGTSTILVNGGAGGSSGWGGDAGDIDLDNWGGTGGAKVLLGGEANASFTTPLTPPAADLGTNPLTITADTTLDKVVDYNNPVTDGAGAFAIGDLYVGTDDIVRTSTAGGVAAYATDVALATGTVYQRIWDAYIYQAGGGVAASDAVFTGLSVAAGTTLTLSDNGGCSSMIGFDNDIDNAGTITKAVNGCDISLYSFNYHASGNIDNAGVALSKNAGRISVYASMGIANSGTINASGFDDAAAFGGNGDEIRLDAAGYVINSGPLDASGGDGLGNGGSANWNAISIYASYIENTAAIDASGGNNTAADMVATPGNGGTGGRVYLSSDYGTNNTGDIDISGGDGSFGGSAYTGSSYLRTNDIGTTRNSGNINMNGGTGHTSSGGSTGRFYIQANGGDAINNADITGNGGDALSLTTGNSRNGARFYMRSYTGSNNTPSGDIELSGNISLNGGSVDADSARGGANGGGVYLYIDGGESAADNGNRVALLGYESLSTNGGDAGFAGMGGWVGIQTSEALKMANLEFTMGSAFNEVPISNRGGNSTGTALLGGDGGEGGQVDVSTSTNDNTATIYATASNTADIDVSGGNSIGDGTFNWARSGGMLGLYAANAVSNSGTLTANAGTGAQYGGQGGGLDMYSFVGDTNNTAEVNANGSDGQEGGGDGGWTWMEGVTSTNGGDVNINGGNATNPGAIYTATWGGRGGWFEMFGQGIDGVVSNTGTISNTPGTGTQVGELGCIRLGPFDITGQCN
ncbi:MAG: hypothetical protein OEY06_03310 [Gammaproteobacteria bacterium]|nr:hypothetical protein [Gammaproteobacteria bacterium]